eukprot:2763707-Amphidinium_carterae.1
MKQSGRAQAQGRKAFQKCTPPASIAFQGQMFLVQQERENLGLCHCIYSSSMTPSNNQTKTDLCVDLAGGVSSVAVTVFSGTFSKFSWE